FLKIFLLVLLASCKPENRRPAGILPEDKMVEIMIDVHIFEAVKESKKIPVDSLPQVISANYQQIFKNHGISEEQFRKSFDYYEHNPAKMDDLMTKVIDELSK